MSVYVESNGKLAFVDILNNTWIDLSAINFFTNEYEETVVEKNSINVLIKVSTNNEENRRK